MSDKEESYIDAASRLWGDAKHDYPKTSLAVSLAPVSGNITSGLELNDAINRGDKTDMALSAAGMIPGGSLVKAGAKAIKSGVAVQRAARNTMTGADIYSASKNAGQIMKNKGAAMAAAGAGAEAANAGSSFSDYADEWNSKP